MTTTNDALKKRVRRLVGLGVTQKAISARLGTSTATLSRWLAGQAPALRVDSWDGLRALEAEFSQPSDESAHAKKIVRDVTEEPPRTSPTEVTITRHTAGSSAPLSRGRFLDGGTDQHGTQPGEDSFIALPSDKQIVKEFVGFAALLNSIAAAFARGEISSARLRDAARAAVHQRNDRLPLRPRKKKKS